MARARQVAVLLLVLFVGLALASAAPADSNPASGPSLDENIGNSDGPSGEDVAEAAPVGGPVSPTLFPPSADQVSVPGPTGGATAHKAVGVAGALVAGAIAAFLSL